MALRDSADSNSGKQLDARPLPAATLEPHGGLSQTAQVSIIVPFYNHPHDLEQCLSALLASEYTNSEILVIDDASTTNEGRQIAAGLGARVLAFETNLGPSSARNYGARHAVGDILFFVDADVVVGPDAVGRVVEVFERNPDVAAVFGSYDDRPRAAGLVSQYRNLLHHYVHQHGSTTASTFWAACGAIRRSVFVDIGGFDDEHYPRCIEDIELGYRLRGAGYRILLDKGLQGTHLKKWTLSSMVRTDVLCRAVPWTRLILETKRAPDDLNIKGTQRVSAGLTGLAMLLMLIAPFRNAALIPAALALLVVLALNLTLYVFFARRRGVLFAAGAMVLHLLYFIYGALTYAYVICAFQLRRTVATSSPAGDGKTLVRPGRRTPSPS
jgi:cellulose synthase/poly-beta-1,6-N-acetylglucosamine synthase-like glycosyltransferase